MTTTSRSLNSTLGPLLFVISLSSLRFTASIACPSPFPSSSFSTQEPTHLPTSYTISSTPTIACIDPCNIDLNRVCPLFYEPVCGCNERTYSNECFAEREGLVRWIQGECESALSLTPTISLSSQPTTSLLPCIDINKINLLHQCPCHQNLVCGCNGRIYRNPCHAANHGVLLWKLGEC